MRHSSVGEGPARIPVHYLATEVRSLAPKPTTVDFVRAAAIPQAALTSWQALFDHGHLESGQTVVIHGAAGGLGSMAVPLARWPAPV
jgi:NADPH:quinone reductase-like Zn-dependent oxidoreductase